MFIRTTAARKLWLAAALAANFLCLPTAQAALNLADPVPIGPQVTVGQLPNGLTYYIHKNTRPEKRLELRLVVKAGSVLEDEDQLGLAHFTEHMAFNGSAHFKKHELISYLQSIGLKFGADLNAYTSFNETVYILPLPTDNRDNVEKGFLVLQDWAGGLSFNDPDIDMERGIVLEELRQGRGAQDRMNKILLPKIFAGTQYAKRLPIGTEANLKGFPFEAVKRFYKDWYRPDLMAVVVVGDIEVADARALVESHFGKLQNPDNERPRTYPVFTARATSEAVVATDKEATNNVMQIMYPVSATKPVLTLGDYRQKKLEQLFGMMLGLRMQELTQQATPPFVGGNSGMGPLMHGFKSFSSSALLGRQGAGPAADALVQENERARQFGFSDAELERSKKIMLRGIEQSYAEREKTNSGVYAAEYIRNFLEAETIPGLANELAYIREMLPSIDVAEINQFARRVIPDKAAKLVLYTGSDKADNPPPTEPQLMGAVQQAEQQKVAAKTEKAVATSLMTTLPKPGRIVSEKPNVALGLTEMELSNGLKVILKQTDFKNDQILMGASRFGGQSLFKQTDKFNAGYAASLLPSMGLGQFAPMELQKMWAGKQFSVNTSLANETESVNASSTMADLETMLQATYLKFGSARKDEDLFKSIVSRYQDAVRNASARPEAALNDLYQTTLYQNHPRVWLTPRPEDLAQIDLERMRSIYQERFASAKGFTFIFVGSFKPETLKPLIATYLASLPTTDLPLAYADMGIRPVQGVVKKEVRAGSEPKAQAWVAFTGPATYSLEENMRVNGLVEVMNIKITDVLREKLTLIYSGGMNGGLSRTPNQQYSLTLNLPCAPENVDKALAAAFAEIKKIQDQGPEAGDLDKVKKNWLLDWRKELRENNFWLNQLEAHVLHGTDAARILDYEQRVAALTAADVQAAAKRYLRQDNYVQTVLYPQR